MLLTIHGIYPGAEMEEQGMADLEKKSGSINPAEEPTPRHNKGVDAKSITRGKVEAS